jgi:hypothetical protein
MLTLDLSCEPLWLDLPHGVRLRVWPVDRIVRAAAEGAALAKAKQALAEAGAPEDSPAFKTLYLLLLTRLFGTRRRGLSRVRSQRQIDRCRPARPAPADQGRFWETAWYGVPERSRRD